MSVEKKMQIKSSGERKKRGNAAFRDDFLGKIFLEFWGTAKHNDKI